MSSVVMLLAGGVGLGTYQAGAYEAMSNHLRSRVGWLAGASIGAVNAALIAGNPPERRAEALVTFWNEAAVPVGAVSHGAWRHGLNWTSVARTRTFGRTGLFAPRAGPEFLTGRALALYRLAPLARKLQRLEER